MGLCLESEPIGQPTGASVQSPQVLSYEEGGGAELVSTMPVYVSPKVKDMGTFSASSE